MKPLSEKQSKLLVFGSLLIGLILFIIHFYTPYSLTYKILMFLMNTILWGSVAIYGFFNRRFSEKQRFKWFIFILIVLIVGQIGRQFLPQ